MNGHFLKYPVAVILAGLIFWAFTNTADAQQAQQANDACRKKKGLVILVEFPGTPPQVSESFVRERFFRLNDYVLEMSYGKECVEVDLTGWHRVPDRIESYAISPANQLVDKRRIFRLIQDSIDAADEKNDFSGYSYIILFLGAQFREYGMVGLCGYPGLLGWKQPIIFKTRRGQTVPGGIAIFTYQAHLGTLFHDIAHIWGGVENGKRKVPCLYDHDLQRHYPTRDANFANSLINMGYWDPLSCHLYKREYPPPGLSSWTRMRLGWIAPEKMIVANPAKTVEVVLDALEDPAARTLVIKIPLSSWKYYLIENRQPLGGFDPYLPGSGILILAADDDIGECRYGKSPVRLINANPDKPHLLGAAFNLPDNGSFTDGENNIEIKLLEKVGNSYKIRIKSLK